MEYEPRATVVHKSLLETKTFLGVEARMAILNGTMTAAISMGLESFIVLGTGVLLHFVLRWITKKDAQMLAIYRRWNLLGHVYDPWSRRQQVMNARPKGFGRGMLC